MTALQRQGTAAKAASYALSTAGTAKKNQALEAIAQILTDCQEEWLSANAEDVAAAKAAGMRSAMLDRLTLTPDRIAGIVEGVRQVIALPDPIGRADRTETRPNGLIIGRRRVPLGVIAIIFEARPYPPRRQGGHPFQPGRDSLDAEGSGLGGPAGGLRIFGPGHRP